MARSRVSDRQAMEMAIAEAQAGIESGQSPFGCCLVKGGKILACAHNTVWQEVDPSAHAEVNAIRDACRRLGTIDLSGSTLYATCEPCPMCFSTAYWARVSRIVFGARIGDAVKAGFSELRIPVARMKEVGRARVRVKPGYMARECRGLFRTWLSRGLRPY